MALAASKHSRRGGPVRRLGSAGAAARGPGKPSYKARAEADPRAPSERWRGTSRSALRGVAFRAAG